MIFELGLVNGPHLTLSKEPYIPIQEAYLFAKEPYILAWYFEVCTCQRIDGARKSPHLVVENDAARVVENGQKRLVQNAEEKIRRESSCA